MQTTASNKQVIYISPLQATNKKILSPPVTKLSDPNNEELYRYKKLDISL